MARMYDVRQPSQGGDNYFVRTYDACPSKIEMSFNLSTYQPTLAAAGLDVYQTYYLEGTDKDTLWTDGQVAPDKVLATRWMRQFAHTWTHFAVRLALGVASRRAGGSAGGWEAGLTRPSWPLTHPCSSPPPPLLPSPFLNEHRSGCPGRASSRAASGAPTSAAPTRW